MNILQLCGKQLWIVSKIDDMVTVYIHGRPKGQDIWSLAPSMDDNFYINPFLDSRIGENIESVLQIDICKANVYYTYIRRKDVFECKLTGRPSAYFAITVRYEKKICLQTATLFNLLETIYQKLCLNRIIEQNGSKLQFLISQFKEKDDICREINSIILQNVTNFGTKSINEIEGINTTKVQPKLYSIKDVDSPQFIFDCNHSRVLVSPSFKSKDEIPLQLKEKLTILESENKNLEDEKNRWQSSAEEVRSENVQLRNEKNKLQGENNALKNEKNAIETNIKERYEKSYKREIDNLKNQLGEEKERNQQLRKKLESSREVHPDEVGEKEIPTRDQEVLNLIWSKFFRVQKRFLEYLTLLFTICNTIILAVFCNCSTNVSSRQVGLNQTDTIEVVGTHSEANLDLTNAKIDIPELKWYQFRLKQSEKYTIHLVEKPKGFVDYRWKVKYEKNSFELKSDSATFKVPKTKKIEILCIDPKNRVIKEKIFKVKK